MIAFWLTGSPFFCCSPTFSPLHSSSLALALDEEAANLSFLFSTPPPSLPDSLSSASSEDVFVTWESRRQIVLVCKRTVIVCSLRVKTSRRRPASPCTAGQEEENRYTRCETAVTDRHWPHVVVGPADSRTLCPAHVNSTLGGREKRLRRREVKKWRVNDKLGQVKWFQSQKIVHSVSLSVREYVNECRMSGFTWVNLNVCNTSFPSPSIKWEVTTRVVQ